MNNAFTNNIDGNKFNSEMFMLLLIMAVLATIGMVILCTAVFGYIPVDPMIIYATISIFDLVILVVTYIRLSNLSKLYRNRVEYDGVYLKVISNRSSQVLREVNMINIRQINEVTDGKNKYIYFTEHPIKNADIKTVRELYKKGLLVYCEYSEIMYEQLRERYFEKFF